MNILFIGNSHPPKILSTFIKDTKGKNNLSCHNYEQSILNGLSQQGEDVHVKVLLVPWVGTFPISYTRLFVRAERFEKYGLDMQSVGYCNLIGINDAWRQVALYKQLLKTFEDFPEGDIHVIINTFKYPVLKGFQEAKKRTKRHVTQTIMMLDMPGFEFTKRQTNPLKRIKMKRDLAKTMEMVRQSDYIVSVTKHFKDYFEKPVKSIVVEGMVNAEVMDKDANLKPSPQKAVLYTGTLMKIYGIMNLLEAFEKADVPDSELWICGSGDMKDEILERSKKNSKIKYLGLLTSEEAWKKQREATVLVNPRTSQGEYTKYSFPSKTLEYLLAGRPVIVNNLPGFPEEYAEHCIFPKDESIEALAESIKRVLSMTEEERTEIGRKGQEFIVKEKNSKRQVGRIIELIRENERI